MQTPPSSAAAPIKAKPQCHRDSSRVSAIRPVAKQTGHFPYALPAGDKGTEEERGSQAKGLLPKIKGKEALVSPKQGDVLLSCAACRKPFHNPSLGLEAAVTILCVHSTQLNTHVHQEGDPGTNGTGLNSLQQIALPKTACCRCGTEVLQLIGQWESQQPVR